MTHASKYKCWKLYIATLKAYYIFYLFKQQIPLLKELKHIPGIPGLCLPGVPLVVSPVHQYADDTTLILSTDDSIKAVFDIYSLFEKASGSRLNQSKSKGLWLGSWVGRLDPPVALDWSPSKLKILGIYVGLGNLEEDNWGARICAVEKTLLSWRQRNLSFRGKALVINALALSRIWYVASLVRMPPWVLRMLDSGF